MNEQKRRPVGILLTVILIAALLTVCLELGLGYLRPDIPGSIPKHLIHFGIMFALLGGAVLLCLFCPPFKKLWAWIDEHILSQETRPIAIDITYAVIAGLMLLHHFYVILYYPTLPTGATKFAPIWLVLAAITVLLGKSWRNISFRLAAIFFIFTFERLYIEKLAITGETAVYFFSAIYALFICLGAFSAIRSSVRKPFLQTLCAMWALTTLVLSIAGLYTTWTGIQIPNLAGILIWARTGRLNLFSVATISASYLSCGIIMGLIGFIISKHKTVKFIYLLFSLITMTANSLTDSRSSFIVIGFMIGGTICLGIWYLYCSKNKRIDSKRKTLVTIIVLVFCFGLCTYLVIESQRFLATSFIDARDQGAFIPNASAEESNLQSTDPPLPYFRQRNILLTDDEAIDHTLTTRFETWEKGLKYFYDNPKSLFFGLSVDGSVASTIERSDHSHNILLQTLLEGGIPALLLYLSLVFYGIYHSFRLWNRKGVPFWQRTLPLPVFAILLWEMVECLTLFAYGHPPMTLFWFFLGATITVSKSLGKPSKSAEQPAISAESAVTETGE